MAVGLATSIQLFLVLFAFKITCFFYVNVDIKKNPLLEDLIFSYQQLCKIMITMLLRGFLLEIRK